MNTLQTKILAPTALHGLLRQHPLAAAAVLGSLLLAGCASTPLPSSELMQARSTVQSANLDRETQTHARLELKRANDTLQQANRLFDQGGDPAEINSAAYIAGRQAQTAMAIGQAKAGDASIAGAELERERARGDMRTRQADRALALADSAQYQARRSREQAAVSEQRASGAEQRANVAEERASGSRLQVAIAQADANAAQAQASEAQRQAALLQQQLSDLQAKPTDRGMLVTLGDVLFESNRSEIKPGAQAGLQRLADFLRQYPQRNILIEGHTDSVGSAPFNEALSRRRASAVDAALAGMGVERQRIAVAGYGEDYPVADNGSDTNRALNRRVEVYIGDAGQTVRTRR
jgi:outer membrane protein OmpA-like peptidoglycan-associated protein